MMGNELEWKSVPGGLCGPSEFTRKILNSGEERSTYTVYGKLGLNPLGRKEVILFCFLLLSSSIHRRSEWQPDRLAFFHQAAHFFIRPGARSKRFLAHYEPGVKGKREGSKPETGASRARPGP